jgi:hypothetical protein
MIGSGLGGFPSRTGEDRTYIYGFAILCATIGFFVIAVYMLFVSKLMPYTGHAVLDWIKVDRYYCLLLPITIPVGIVFVYLNWMSLKFFRHN